MTILWLEGLTWWNVHPLGFSGAEPESAQVHTPVHRLRHVASWLDYAIELGCGGLALGPVFASRTDGSDPTDHLAIDVRLGDQHDFDDLVAACRARGLRVLLEADFTSVLAGEAGAEPGAGDYVALVLDHWLSRGVDGWRLTGSSRVEPHRWRDVLALVRPQHPQAWFVGEGAPADPTGVIDESGLDSTVADALWPTLWTSLNDLDYTALAAQVGVLSDYAGAHPPLTYLGSHDVTRIASNLYDQRHLGHAIATLLTLPGVPSVYYGDEQAFRGSTEERFGGLAAVRPMFPDRAQSLAPWGWPVFDVHRHLIDLRARRPWLTRARVEVLTNTGTGLALRMTPHDSSEHSVTTLLNIADPVTHFSLADSPGQLLAQSDQTWHEHEITAVSGHAWRVLGDPT